MDVGTEIIDNAFLREVDISEFEKSKGYFGVINENKSYTDSEIPAQEFKKSRCFFCLLHTVMYLF